MVMKVLKELLDHKVQQDLKVQRVPKVIQVP